MFNPPTRLFQLLAGFFVLVGLGLLTGAALSYRSTTAFLRTADSATGEVIGYQRRDNSEDGIVYFPVIVFSTASGEEIEFVSSTGSSTRGYRIGAAIPVRYDPALPFNAMIDAPADIWLTVGVLGVLGVAFSGAGAAGVYFFRPSAWPLSATASFDDDVFEDSDLRFEDFEAEERDPVRSGTVA